MVSSGRMVVEAAAASGENPLETVLGPVEMLLEPVDEPLRWPPSLVVDIEVASPVEFEWERPPGTKIAWR